MLEETRGERLKTQSAGLGDASWRNEKDSEGGGATAVSVCGTSPSGRPPIHADSGSFLAVAGKAKKQVRHVERKQIQM